MSNIRKICSLGTYVCLDYIESFSQADLDACEFVLESVKTLCPNYDILLSERAKRAISASVCATHTGVSNIRKIGTGIDKRV